jgi:hypothetical protein
VCSLQEEIYIYLPGVYYQDRSTRTDRFHARQPRFVSNEQSPNQWRTHGDRIRNHFRKNQNVGFYGNMEELFNHLAEVEQKLQSVNYNIS